MKDERREDERNEMSEDGLKIEAGVEDIERH